MSVVASRAAIVTALEMVGGLSVTPAAPPTITTYSAWPVLSLAEPFNYCVDEATWYVFIALPAGSNAASVAAGDILIDSALPHFKTVGKVTAVEPWSWPAEPGQQSYPVIRFTLEA